MAFDTILNPIFGPLLKLSPLWAIIIISLVIAVIITFVYKWMTDQNLMKSLKGDIKKFQKEMKELKHEPQKVMAIQKKAMQTNMKYMMHSMKPTLITFLPIILIFGWLNAHLAYDPINPGEEFTTTVMFQEGVAGNASIIAPEQIKVISDIEAVIVDNKITWTLKGEAGEYLLEYVIEDRKYSKDLLITDKQEYKQPIKIIKNDDKINTIQINQEKIKPLNLFGWRVGWLGTYIIFSIIFSMSLRKLMKLH